MSHRLPEAASRVGVLECKMDELERKYESEKQRVPQFKSVLPNRQHIQKQTHSSPRDDFPLRGMVWIGHQWLYLLMTIAYETRAITLPNLLIGIYRVISEPVYKS